MAKQRWFHSGDLGDPGDADEGRRLGTVIKLRRTELGMARRELAEKAGLSYPYVAELENGTKQGSRRSLSAIADALEMRPSDLYAWTDDLAESQGVSPSDSTHWRHTRSAVTRDLATTAPLAAPLVAGGVVSDPTPAVDGLPGWLGIETVNAEAGRLLCELPVREELLTPFGSLHGGVIAALVDHVLGMVLYPVIPKGSWAATTEFKVNYLAPVRDGVLRATAEIKAMTKRTAVVQIEVMNGDRRVALAQGTVLIQAPRPKAEPAE